MANPTTYASPLQHVGFAVETTQGTAISAPTVTVPVISYTPFDQPVWLDDKSLVGVMTEPIHRVQGVKHTEADIAGIAYFDTLPYLLANLFGDVVYSGTYTGSGTTTLDSGSSVGAVSVSTVASVAASTLVQIGVGTLSEVRLTTGVSGVGPYAVTFATPLVNAHLAAAVVKPVTAPYITQFSLLNTGTAQPGSLTVFDFQGPTASTGTRAYPGSCLSEVGLKGTVDSTTIDYTGKFQGWPSAAATAFTSAPSSDAGQPAWESQVGLVGTVSGAPVLTVNDWGLTISRELETIFTGQNTQNPYFIQRGKLTAAGALNAVVNNETFLTYLNSNTQPQLQVIVSNGLTGANLRSMQVDVQLAAFSDSKITRGKAAVEYAATYLAVANSTNVGYSGGLGPVTLTITNGTAPTTYPFY